MQSVGAEQEIGWLHTGSERPIRGKPHYGYRDKCYLVACNISVQSTHTSVSSPISVWDYKQAAQQEFMESVESNEGEMAPLTLMANLANTK